jgi:hydrogenase maturation protease
MGTSMNREGRTLIVGIGSDFGDDRLGLLVAERLMLELPTSEIRQLRSPLDLLDCLDDFESSPAALSPLERLHVIDACRGAGEPGTLFRLDWPVDELASIHFSGTHDFGLWDVLQLAECLQQLPKSVTIWGAEASEPETNYLAADDEHTAGQRMSHEAFLSLTPKVSKAAEILVQQIVFEITGHLQRPKETGSHA